MYARVATAIVAVAGAPLVEELIYRGVLYPAIERVAGLWPAIMIVSLLFAGVHVVQYRNNIAVIAIITLLSFTLTIARAATGSLIPSFLIHLIFNGIQSIMLVLSPFLEKHADKTDQAVPAATPGLVLVYHLFERIITGFQVF